MNKPFIVPRSCTRKTENKAEPNESRPFGDYRNLPAYVLLGDPGAGKTSAFVREAEESCGKYVKARDFATFEPGAEYKGKTLFIDALDEMRAGGGDSRTPLDEIRKHLERLGRPPFRLSCREADWLGASDSEALKRVSSDGNIIVLHLDPLTDENVAEILRRSEKIPKPKAFIYKAQEHRLDELLRNPQTLNLLVEAVGGAEWPKSRTEVYEMACHQLVSEKNPEHRKAKREKTHSADTLLDAAGYLCAVQLLSGIAGFSLDGEISNEQYVSWNELREHRHSLLAALRTNLFQGDGEERRIPVHRSVAEYLGARDLAKRIEDHGLPLARVLTLLTGEDGGVVTDLRGLAAWLCVHCISGRHELIERDSLGVVLYGDVSNFPMTDKQLVLAALRDEAQRYPWFRSGDWSSPPFGALGTMDMAPAFHDILSSHSRSEADQALLDCALDAICYGEHVSALDDLIDTIARDASYRPRVRVNAIHALMHVSQDDHSRLLKLAEDIRDGLVDDGDDEILGTLLESLYPHTISLAQIVGYLHPPKAIGLVGRYLMFWDYHFPAKSTEQDLPVLLDMLAQAKLDIGKIWVGHRPYRMAGDLLTQCLKIYGDQIDDRRLYDWLGIGLDEYGHPGLDDEYTEQIAAWFAGRPERLKSVIEVGLALSPAPDEIWICINRCEMRLYGSVLPSDIGLWYLEKVKQAAAEQQDKRAATFFMKVIILLIQQGGQQYLTLPALEFLETWVGAYPILQPLLDAQTSCPLGEWQQEHAKKDREMKAERQKHKNELVSFYRQNIAAIREGNACTQIFYDLARAYSGLLIEASGKNPRERLEHLLDDDQELVEAAYNGLRNTLYRNDLPSVDEIADLSAKGQTYCIIVACLVGMEELYRAHPLNALQLPDGMLSRVLAGRFSYNVDNDPPWFIALIQARPALVAEVLIAYVLPMLRAGKEHISGLSQLAYSDAYSGVASIALPKLLEGFPLRARKSQLAYALDPLLKGGLHHADRKQLESLIARKLALDGMDAAQRVYWFGCALLISPETYEARLFECLGKSRVRRDRLASFLHNVHGERIAPERALLPESTLANLVALLAPDCSPERFGGFVTQPMNTAEMIESFINILGGSPNKAASSELERLLTLQSLKHWHNHFRRALHTQRIARRKATFQRPGVLAIGLTLANSQPSGAADLSALTFDHLRDIARRIRDGSTNDYRQYWSYGQNNKKLDKPKPENDCRDALLSDLQARLGRLSIDAQPEGYYADNKRADIRVSFGGANGFNVPIEIKKDCHPDLWGATHEQLIPKYVRDPGTEGRGVYLVFWFGGNKLPPPPDGRVKPSSAQELEGRLRLMLSHEESLRILVCVIDCALPRCSS